MSDYPSDPSMFAQLTREENRILCHAPHLGLVQAGRGLPEPVRALAGNRSAAHRPQRSAPRQLPGPAHRPHGTPGQRRRAGTAGTGGRAVTLSISHPEPGARLGADQCPGVDERGHGLTMAVIHDTGCCQEWETGHASTPARAESFRHAAARWGTAWPGTAPASPAHPGLRPRQGTPERPRRVGRPPATASAKPHQNPKPRPANPPDRAGDGPRFLHPPSPALAAEPRKENRP